MMVPATKVWKKSERALQVSKIGNKYKFILKQKDFYTYILIKLFSGLKEY